MKNTERPNWKKGEDINSNPPAGLQGTLIRSCQCLMWGLCFLPVSALQNGGTLWRTGPDPPFRMWWARSSCTPKCTYTNSISFRLCERDGYGGFFRWSVMRAGKNGREIFLGCIISQPTIIVSRWFGDPKMSPATRCCRTLIVTLKDRSLLF